MSQIPTTNWGDFDVDTINSAVAGHTLRGGGAPTFKPQYTTAAINAYFKRYGAFVNDVTTDYHAFSRDVVDADSNRATFDRVVLLIMDLTDQEEWHIYARGQGTATMTDFVRARIVKASGVIAIDKMVASAYTAGSGASASTVTLTAGHCYFARFRGNAGAISLKVWDASLGRAGEPTAFNLTPTGFTPTAAGWWALGGRHSTLTGKTAAFGVDAGATNADVAVCPRTNTERTAWLGGKVLPGESGLRAVLAKMRFTGYDSSGSPYTATRKAYISNYGYTSAAQDTPALQHFDNYLIGVPSFSREMPAALSGQAVVNIGKMRVSNPAIHVPGTTYLLLDGSSGCNATTPDAAPVDITGDIDIRAKIAADDWTPAAVSMIVAKWQAGGNLAYRLYLNTTGTLVIHWTVDGTTILSAASSVATGFTDGSAHWVRVTMDVDDGGGNRVIKFYTSEDGLTWTQLGTTTTTAGTTSIFSGTSKLEIGSSVNGTQERLAGKVYRAQVYNGIAGTLVADFNLTNVIKGTTSFSGPTGEVWTINGTAKIRQNDDTTPGARDDWARIHWLRDGFELLLGDPTWPLHDFLHLVRGRLGKVTAIEMGLLEFEIADMSEALKQRLVTSRIASGDYVDQFWPAILGVPRAVELVGDRATLVYNVHDGALLAVLNDTYPCIYDVTPTAFAHVGTVSGLTVSAVNTGTGEITASANHGMSNGYRHRFTSGTPPLSLALNTNYWVVGTTAGTDKYKLSLTQGGAAITGGGSSTGSAFDGYGYTFNLVTGTVTLVSPPAGRIIGVNIGSGDADITSNFVSDVFADLFFNLLGLSLNYKDSASFAAAVAVDGTDNAVTGYFMKTGAGEVANAVADRLAAGNCAWYGFAPDGLMQTGSRALPAATAAYSFTHSDVTRAGPRQVGALRPINFALASMWDRPWFLVGGPVVTPNVDISAFTITSQETLQGRHTVTPYSYGAAGIPLDDHPDQGDPREDFEFQSLGLEPITLETRMVVFHKHQIGLFEFDVKRLSAVEVTLGQTISLEFPRLGWKQYSSADPASPDNTATLDARLAVVIGQTLRVNKDGNSYDGVGLKVFRRIPGYYPTANLN